MNVYSLLIDLILLLTIGLAVYLAAQRGFVRTVLEAVGLLAAVIITLTICTPLANATYDRIIEPPLLEAANQEFNSSVEDAVNQALGLLPDFIQNYAETEGIVLSEALESGNPANSSAQKIVAEISQNTIKPIAARLISAIYSLVILSVLLIIVKVLAAALNKAFSFSLVGKINTFLGGVCGLIKGLAIAFLVCIVIYTVISFTENGWWIFTYENIEKTIIFKTLIGLIKI